MDLLGQILWITMFLTPLFTIPFVWNLMDTKKIFRVTVGLILSLILSFILYVISLAIIFREGMGS